MISTASDPPEVSLDDALPFADFVQSLRGLGLPIDIKDLLAVEKLVRRWRGTKEGLGRAMGALLARNRDDVVRIVEAFQAWFPEERIEIDSPPSHPPVPERQHKRVAPWVAGLVIALGLVTVAWWALRRAPEPAPRNVPAQIADVPNNPTQLIVDRTPPPPAPQPPAPPHRPAAGFPWLAAAFAALAILTGAVELRSGLRRGKAARRQAADELADGMGPHRYESTVKPGGPPFPPSWVEEAAMIIGRGVEEDATSDQLDVDETLRLTLREGVRPVLAFEPPPRNSVLLVLEDTSPAMAPWSSKVAFLLDELVRQGIAVERWFFETDPSLVSREQFGRTIRLERLADTQGERSLVVIATGEGLDEVLRQRKRLTSTLKERWTRRSWLNPIANRRYWPPGVRRAPMNVWPMTRDGLRGMSWELATAPIVAASARRAAEVRDVTADDVERIKRLIALVPHPTLALAEQLRRRYCPDVPDEVILFLAREGALHGERVLLADEEVRRLLSAQRREAPSRERRVREYLIDVLDASTPPEGSVAHLRWQADRALQTINAAAAAGDATPPEAIERLAALADGPLAEEVESAVELTHAPALVRARVKEASRRFATRARGLTPRWAAPGALWMLAATLLAFASYRSAKPIANGRGEVVPHVIGAYQLRFTPLTYPSKTQVGIINVVRSLKDVPEDVELYSDKRHFSAPHRDIGWFVSEEETGSWWQARASMQPYGNLALSDAVWVPKMHFVEGLSAPPRFADPRHDTVPAPVFLKGQVLDAPTGLPLANAQVSIDDALASSDSSGAFHLKLPSGVSSGRIHVVKQGYEQYTYVLPAKSIPRGVLIRLYPTSLSGMTGTRQQQKSSVLIAFDVAEGEHRMGDSLRFSEVPYQLMNGTEIVKGTSAEPVELSPGSWTLTASVEGYEPVLKMIKVEPGSNDSVKVILRPSQQAPPPTTEPTTSATTHSPIGEQIGQVTLLEPSDGLVMAGDKSIGDKGRVTFRWKGTSQADLLYVDDTQVGRSFPPSVNKFSTPISSGKHIWFVTTKDGIRSPTSSFTIVSGMTLDYDFSYAVPCHHSPGPEEEYEIAINLQDGLYIKEATGGEGIHVLSINGNKVKVSSSGHPCDPSEGPTVTERGSVTLILGSSAAAR